MKFLLPRCIKLATEAVTENKASCREAKALSSVVERESDYF